MASKRHFPASFSLTTRACLQTRCCFYKTGISLHSFLSNFEKKDLEFWLKMTKF